MNNVCKVSALFLDRDGVINFDSGYIKSLDSLRLNYATIELAKICNENNVRVFVVTNQSGIARGYLTLEKLKEINEVISEHYQENGARIEKFFYCPHHPEGLLRKYKKVCDCRKPEPGLILQAAKEYSINLKKAWLIGDKERDVISGINAGIPESQCILNSSISLEELNTPLRYSNLMINAQKLIKILVS